jgi:hypothetical protein
MAGSGENRHGTRHQEQVNRPAVKPMTSRILRALPLFLALACAPFLEAQIPDVKILMKEGDLRTFLSRDPFDETYLPAVVTIGDTTWKEAEIRYKGRSTRYYPKKSFRVRFPKDHPYLSAQALNLNAMYTDRSMVREHLAWDLFGAMRAVAPKASYMGVTLNGAPKGLFLRVERIDKHFLKNRGLRATSLYNAGGFYTLADMTDQPVDLLKLYYQKEIGDTTDYRDLQELLGLLNHTPDERFEALFDSLFDAKSVLDWFSGNILMSMGDSYSKNYFLAHDASRRLHAWTVIPWDYDGTFGLTGDPDTPFPDNLLNDGFAYSFPPLMGLPNILKDKFTGLPSLRARLVAYTDTLLRSIYTEERLFPRIDSLARAIRSAALADTSRRKQDAGDFDDAVEAVKYFITARRNFLLKTFTRAPQGEFGVVMLWSGARDTTLQFIGRDGRTFARLGLRSIGAPDNITVFSHADSLPPCLSAADSAFAVRRWVEIIPGPKLKRFKGELRWEYVDIWKRQREVASGVKNEKLLRCFLWNGKSAVPADATVNTFSNVVTVHSITEKDCGNGKYFFLRVP